MLRASFRPVSACLPRLVAVAAFLGVAGLAWTQDTALAKPGVKSWSARDCGGGPINLGVVQHPVTGFIYVGNGRGVLEFDGVRWRLITLPARGPGRTLAVDGDGTVWVGSYNEIAVLQADATGELRAVSVLDRVAVPDRIIEFVSQALPTAEGMCMVEQGHVFLFQPDGSTRVWKCPQVPLRAWWMDGKIHLVLTGAGIFRLEAGGELRPVPLGGGAPSRFDPSQLRVLAARALEEGRTMLLTSRGPAVWTSAERTLRPATETVGHFEGDEVTAADFTSDGRMILATEAGALFQLDEKGGTVARRLAFGAFASGRVTGMAEDREGGVWVAKAVGLARLQFGDPAAPGVSPPAAVVRRVVAGDERKVLGGATAVPASPLALGPDHTRLRFEFAAPTYRFDPRGSAGVMFRSQLEGLDRDWSEWTGEAQRNFESLPLGNFRLRVQARDVAGRAGPEAVLAFSLAQHWWLTPWAYAGYVGTMASILAGTYQLLTRAHRRRAAQLEAIVAARTEDLRRSNAELARLREIDRDEKVAARLAEEKARLEVLRYQLNPHFLYNALNSLYSLVLTAPPAAADMVLRLADFCRVALERNDEERITVGTCFDRMGLYLEIEKVRWGASLQVEIVTDEAVREENLPPFLVLPLLENAIKYGGATSPELLRVNLIARIHAETATTPRCLEIEVANTGHWALDTVDQVPGSTSIGLENLRQRLQRYYPDRHELVIESRDGWVVVRLRLQAVSAPVLEITGGTR